MRLNKYVLPAHQRNKHLISQTREEKEKMKKMETHKDTYLLLHLSVSTAGAFIRIITIYGINKAQEERG